LTTKLPNQHARGGTELRKIVKVTGALLLQIVAPDEAELGGKPSWQFLMEGTGDRWDSLVGNYFQLDISCQGLCNVIKGELARKLPLGVVEEFWPEFQMGIEAFYMEYSKAKDNLAKSSASFRR
jgi:hypothetical protein